MTDKLKCPFCGAELTINSHPFDGCVKARCVNGDCRYAEWTFPLEIWQALIDGKKAQDALNKIWHSPNEKPAPFRTIITEDGEWYWDTNGYYQGDTYWRNDTPWAYLQDVVDLIEITSITKQESNNNEQ